MTYSLNLLRFPTFRTTITSVHCFHIWRSVAEYGVFFVAVCGIPLSGMYAQILHITYNYLEKCFSKRYFVIEIDELTQ